VIGGPGAFTVVIKDRARFKEAIRTKLVLEVADLQRPAVVIPAQAKTPRIPCTAGEKASSNPREGSGEGSGRIARSRDPAQGTGEKGAGLRDVRSTLHLHRDDPLERPAAERAPL